MVCLRNKTRILDESVIFFVFGRYILWLWELNIKQFLYWLQFPSFSWAALQLNRCCVFFSMNFRQRYPYSPVKALLVVQWESLWFVDMDLPSRAETHKFDNSEILKRLFSELLLVLQKTNCSQQQIFQTRNLMETIHRVYERGSVNVDHK